MNLPPAFVQQMQALLGDDFNAFKYSLLNETTVSIRWNDKVKLNNKENYEGVKWNAKGVYLKERPVFTLDPLLHAGAYYVQEASSMSIASVLQAQLNVNQPLKVLDLCAAPGGKSTLLLSEIHDNSLLVANEVIRNRYQILQENLCKWGNRNVMISNHETSDFNRLAGYFDIILVDAPCSGEGLFRKDPKAMDEWSPQAIQQCAIRQQKILTDAQQLLSPNGKLIYSTCTYNHKENIENALWLHETFGLESLQINFPDDWNIEEQQLKNVYGYQFYPHRVQGEGFFISVFQHASAKLEKTRKALPFKHLKRLKASETASWQHYLQEAEKYTFFQTEKGTIFALQVDLIESYKLLSSVLYKSTYGLQVGMLKGKELIPSHHLAVSKDVAKDLPTIQLDKQQALKYLKRENFELTQGTQGWCLVQFDGVNLGWVKGLEHRLNNYYPKEWRIRMEI